MISRTIVLIIILCSLIPMAVSCTPKATEVATTSSRAASETGPQAEAPTAIKPTAVPTEAPTQVPQEPKAASPTLQAIETASPVGSLPQGTALAEIRSAATSISGDEPLELQIVLTGVEDLYGVQFQITFDPELVRVGDGDESLPGIQLTPATAFQGSDVFVAVNRADPESGSIEFIATLLGDAKPMAGDVAVASFLLQAVGSGQAVLEFAEIKLAASDASALPVTSQGVVLSIQP